MKLLHIIDSADPARGGPIEGIKQLATALQSLGSVVEVACVDSPDEPWIGVFPFKIHALGPAYTRYRYAPALTEWLEDHARDYDAVVVNGIWQYHSFAAHGVMHKLGVPYSVFTHGMLDPWFQDQYPFKHLKKRFYWRFGEYPVLRDAHTVLFTCTEESALATESFKPHLWRSTVVNYGTSGPPGPANEEREAFLSRFPHLADARIVLFFGRLAAKKGVDLLIKAFAEVADRDPKLHLVLAGPAEQRLDKEQRRLAHDLNVSDRITWTGMLQGLERWGAYRAAEVFVLASHQENFGISVAEALACGVPVLISNKVNIWREIEDGCAGFVQPDTVEGTVAILESWLALSESEREAMGVRARDLFLKCFEIKEAARAVLTAVDPASSVEAVHA